MGLGSFSNISKEFPKIKLHINHGEIVLIEKEENGFWLPETNLIKVFDQLPKKLNIYKKAIITIIQ